MMMLRQSSLPSSTEADLSFASEHGEKVLSCDKHPKGGHERAFPVTARKISCGSCSTDFPSSSSQQSTVATMYENSTPTFVYRRRKQQRVSAAVFPAQASTKAKPSGNCLSVISSETPSVAAKEHIEIESRAVRAPVLLPVECTGRALISKSASISGCSLGEEVGSVEDPKHDMLRIVDVCCVNDSCSSSKSNMVLCAAALKTEMDDTGDCSSSEAFIMDGLHEDISEKDVRISILRCLGLYKGVWPIKRYASHEGSGINSDSGCLRSCKVCDQLEITIKMLICDQCEEAFHVSCCNPRVRKIPLDEWFCHFCLKKKLEIMETTTRESLNSSIEMGRCRKATSKGALGPIAIMLEDTEPYTTNVRIGPEFQAEVPDWSGLVGNDEDDNFGEPLEMNPSKGVSFHEGNSRKPSRLSSISNWLQCLQVIEGVGGGVDGTVCRKWRRAPLFEIQTDDWECFRSVLWDSTYADCAVPQELDTDQVLKDLKYIEMLRPRVAAKKRKLGCSKSMDPEGRPVKDVRNEDAP